MDLLPQFPIVDGPYRMTPEWTVTTPVPMNRRFEDKMLVLWRPGLTAWITVWGSDEHESQQARLAWIKEVASKEAFDRKELRRDNMIYYSYRLLEPANDKRLPALYCFAVGATGHVQVALYFNHEADAKTAESICHSICEDHEP